MFVYSYFYIQRNVRQCLRQVTWRQATERGRVLRRTSVSFEEHHTDADFDRIHVSQSFVLIFMFLTISTSREEHHAHNYVVLRWHPGSVMSILMFNMLLVLCFDNVHVLRRHNADVICADVIAVQICGHWCSSSPPATSLVCFCWLRCWWRWRCWCWYCTSPAVTLQASPRSLRLPRCKWDTLLLNSLFRLFKLSN